MDYDNFIKTFCQLQNKLHRVACRILKDEMEAEDAVQDTFCNLWSDRIPDTFNEARFRLFSILRNVCLNKLKRKRNFVELSEYPNVCQESDIDDSERLKFLLMASLSPLQREIFRMATFDDMEYEVIAERLDMSVDAVRMNMSRARKKMRELYNKI